MKKDKPKKRGQQRTPPPTKQPNASDTVAQEAEIMAKLRNSFPADSQIVQNLPFKPSEVFIEFSEGKILEAYNERGLAEARMVASRYKAGWNTAVKTFPKKMRRKPLIKSIILFLGEEDLPQDSVFIFANMLADMVQHKHAHFAEPKYNFLIPKVHVEEIPPNDIYISVGISMSDRVLKKDILGEKTPNEEGPKP